LSGSLLIAPRSLPPARILPPTNPKGLAMPALPHYIPAQENEFTSWLANFSTLISAK
jgi:hypothetical protein